MMSVRSFVGACVLCSIAIVKNGDKNLVEGRSEFDAKSEILSLDFGVIICSPYVCKSCLAKLKKRRALISNLSDVNASLRHIYFSSANGSNREASYASATTKSCSRSLFESDEQLTKRVALLDGKSPERPQFIGRFPHLTSTPHREQGLPDLTAAVSPITHTDLPINTREEARKSTCEQNENKKTTVQVRVEWASKHKVNTLPESLESLGKMLCRGTYKQIAGAVWKNPILKKHVQQLFLKDVDRECTALCSVKHPSCLRSPSKKDLRSFSFAKLNNELETKAPLFSAVLWTASLRKSKRDDQFWQPSVCMSAAVLLKNRSPCMTAIQLLNTIILYHTGIIVSTMQVLFLILS